jgi:hypothetical protein
LCGEVAQPLHRAPAGDAGGGVDISAGELAAIKAEQSRLAAEVAELKALVQRLAGELGVN